MDGTGWQTADGSISHQSDKQTITLGGHTDRVELVSTRYSTTNWLTGARGAVNQQSLGKTRTSALWAQDSADLTDTLRLVGGGDILIRWEEKKAAL